MRTPTHLPGAPCWAELATADVSSACSFYRDLLGWDGAGTGRHVSLTLRGDLVGAIARAHDATPSRWELYFCTGDVAATSRVVQSLGGRVTSPARPVFDLGYAAVYRGPDGAAFGAWQPGARAGVAVMAQPGALSWCELATGDADRATSFYTGVFGWSCTRHTAEGFSYTDVGAAAAPEPFGGIAPSGDLVLAGRWRPYCGVADTDAAAARAARLGARIVSAPATLAIGARICALLDPGGAAFSLISRDPSRS
jgi:predicted enzyme related to lactoylglutathione lyase